MNQYVHMSVIYYICCYSTVVMFAFDAMMTLMEVTQHTPYLGIAAALLLLSLHALWRGSPDDSEATI